MGRFPRPAIKRAREHLLHALRMQRELCYLQDDTGHHQALVSAAGVDSAWYWPAALIRQAAQQLERAGLVETTGFQEDVLGDKPVLQITLLAKGSKPLPSRKKLRGHAGCVACPARPLSGPADGVAARPSPAVVSRSLPS